ncbi:hypothetical protein [Pontibacter liquoris]|uniref:hypothetical protein n=1 Tax=Pontibacter liquoris TaxID=2905677 RepID=UPI001FA7A5FF|nr:hypothetical protein [Pontibacter liquoris]
MVEVNWYCHVTTEQLQGIFYQVLDVLREYKPSYFLADTCHLGGFLLSDQLWLKIKIFPELEKTNVQGFARITAPDILAEAINNTFEDPTQTDKQFKFNMQCFHHRNEALEWLFQQAQA